MTRTNYFENPLGAERYAAARPEIHATAIQKFLAFAAVRIPLPRVLDVGCGTGQSAEVLATVADHVIGVDASAEMLAVCKPHPRIEYRQTSAESIPYEDESFDLITVAQAFHWFRQNEFLAEAHRLLKASHWLVIYTSGFTAEMKGNAGFADWFKQQYLKQYPTPPRGATPVSEALARDHGFTLRGVEDFSMEIRMTAQRFTDYQLSTTNVLAAAKDAAAMAEAEQWIAGGSQPYFGNEAERAFIFAGRNWYLQKDA